MEINQENVEAYLEQKKKVSISDIRDYFNIDIYEEKQELDAILFDLDNANYLIIEHPKGQKEKDEILQADTMIYLAGN